MTHSTRAALLSSALLAVVGGNSAAVADTPPAPAAAATAPMAPPVEPVSNEAASYSLGITYGEELRRAGLQPAIQADVLMRGINDGLGGKASAPGDRQKIQTFLRATREAQGAKNKAAAAEFLAKNGKEPGVITTASGLEYKITAAGDAKAASPQPTDEVTVQYRGKLLDGTEFDSSYARNEPATFPVRGVIKGWQEALSLMKPGAKWQVYIPPELGYDMKSPPAIPPGSVLIFDVELLSIKAPPAKPTEKPAVKPAVKSKEKK
jgi:FKBP-type peptidyl-prolyl cis-trans isomerase FklB